MSNIVNKEVERYIRETLKDKEGLLKELEEYAAEYNVPIVHKEVSDLLKVLLKVQKPKSILEVGCAIGYSSILFSTSTNGEAKIITVERNEKMIEQAKMNFERSGFSNNITLLEGDAEELLKNVEGEFDMIFLDAAKGQYKLFYDLVIDKLKVGGLLISDNILYKGMIADDALVMRRKKTIVKRMRNYSEDRLIIDIKEGKRYLTYDHIICFEAFEKKIKVSYNQEKLSFYGSLKELERVLPSGFIRCHRSYIVNAIYIKEMNHKQNILILQNKLVVPISKKFKNNMIHQLNEMKMNSIKK